MVLIWLLVNLLLKYCSVVLCKYCSGILLTYTVYHEKSSIDTLPDFKSYINLEFKILSVYSINCPVIRWWYSCFWRWISCWSFSTYYIITSISNHYTTDSFPVSINTASTCPGSLWKKVSELKCQFYSINIRTGLQSCKFFYSSILSCFWYCLHEDWITGEYFNKL